MNSKKKINIGIMGCADIAQRIMIPAFKRSHHFEVVAVASRSYDKAKDFASRFGCVPINGYAELLERKDIEAIYMPLPNGLHYEWIKQSLMAGKHVIAEKSITTNLAQTNILVDLAYERKLTLYENFMFVYHSQIDFVREKLKSGAIGELHIMRASFGFPISNPDVNIRYKRELGGGALLDAGAYTVKAVQLFLGDGLQLRGAALKIHPYYGVDWWGGALFSDSSGAMAQIAFSFENFYQNKIELWGSSGKITMERAFTAAPGYSPTVVIEKQNKKNNHFLPADDHFLKIINDFANAITTGDNGRQYKSILDQSKWITGIFEYDGKG
jgi:predicted dehydrogenase